MSPDSTIPGSPLGWLARAKGSLALAKQLSEEEYREAIRLAEAVVAWADGIISSP